MSPRAHVAAWHSSYLREMRFTSRMFVNIKAVMNYTTCVLYDEMLENTP